MPADPDRIIYRIDGDYLVAIGFLNDLPANNAPWYTFGPSPADPEGIPYEDVCEHWVEMQFRDGDETWCPLCAPEHRTTRLKRKILQAPYSPDMWHSFYSHVTGRMESDPRAFERHGKDNAKRAEDDLGIRHDFTRADASELSASVRGYDRKGRNRETVAGEALRTTHDRAVKEGRKPSKGKFVHTVTD